MAAQRVACQSSHVINMSRVPFPVGSPLRYSEDPLIRRFQTIKVSRGK